MTEDQPRVVEVLRDMRRRSTAVGVLGALVFVSLVVVRRELLRRDALANWAAHSVMDARQSAVSVRAWLAVRHGETRLLATAAARTPAIFGVPTPTGARTTAAELSRSLQQSLVGINQLHAYSAIWLLDMTGKVMGSTSRAPPPPQIEAIARAALASDSGAASVPFPDSAGVSIAVAQRVSMPATAVGGTSHGTIIGSAVLVANVATLFDELAALSRGSQTATASLVVGTPDSVIAFVLTPPRLRGHVTGAWSKARAPAFARAIDATHADSSATVRGDTAEFSVRIGRLPWALAHAEPMTSVLDGVNSRLSSEASIAAAVIFLIAIIAIARRQTKRERELVEVAESEVRYRLLADNATDVIARLAPDGRILYISPAVYNILGYQPRQLQGRFPSDFFPEGDPTTMEDVLSVLRSADGVSRAEHQLRHANGHYVWLETTGRAVRDPVWNRITEFVTVGRDIEERKQAETALRASEEDYRMLFDGNPLPMWAFDTSTYQFVAVNEAAILHYGYTREEFLAMTIFDIRPQGDVQMVRDKVREARTGILSVPGVRHRTKNGELIEVDITVHDMELRGRTARLVLAKDVTAARRAAAALRESNELIRALFDSSPLAIIATDMSHRVLQWNGAAERLFGWTAAEVIGKDYPLATGASTQEMQRIRDTALRDGTYIDVAVQRVRKDGSPVDLSLSVGVIRDVALQPSGYVLLAADVSDRAQLEAQVRHAQKMDAVGQLASGVAHEFNNLLTVVTGYAGIVLSDLAQDSPMRNDVAEILAASDRAGDLTRHLLAFSRQQVLRPRVINLNPLVQSTEKMLRRVLTPDIDLVIQLEEDLSTVNADPAQIEQVLMNLILNARDAMQSGGTIVIATHGARLGTTGEYRVDGAQENYVTLSVSDNGSGMTDEVQARMFEPFFTTKAAGEGSGLGLSTAHGIVTQSGGRMTVTSRLGAGTTVTVWLPRIKGPEVAADPELHADLGGAESPRTILLVEDDPAVRSTTTRLLERAGFNVLGASNGNEGLAVHAEHPNGIDLLLTDLVMPGINGRELAVRIHQREPDLPVLLMSGYAEHVARDEQLARSGFLFIDKPFTLDALLQNVRRAIDSRRDSSLAASD